MNLHHIVCFIIFQLLTLSVMFIFLSWCLSFKYCWFCFKSHWNSTNFFPDQTTLLLELTPKARKDECVRFALEIRQAWALSNYIRLFKQYSNAPRMASYIMDLFIEKERKEFLNACLKSLAFFPVVDCIVIVH